MQLEGVLNFIRRHFGLWLLASVEDFSWFFIGLLPLSSDMVVATPRRRLETGHALASVDISLNFNIGRMYAEFERCLWTFWFECHRCTALVVSR